MAQSTAVRFRARTHSDNLAASDALARLSGDISRTLLETIDVSDNGISTHVIVHSGDRIESFSDGTDWSEFTAGGAQESIDVSDSIIIRKNQRRILFDQVVPTDAGFITDKDLLRFRVLQDSITFTDAIQKTITVGDGALNFIVRVDNVIVTDSYVKTLTGIRQRTLVDALSVADFIFAKYEVSFDESFDVSDSFNSFSTNNRAPIDAVIVTDDIIVTRSSKTFPRITSDALALTDRVEATYIEHVIITAKIKTGIEAL